MRILRLWIKASGSGGWAFIAEEGGRVLHESNGVADLDARGADDLQAVIEALVFAQGYPRRRTVQLCSDSKYIVDGVNTWLPLWLRVGWQRRGRPINNLARWQRIATLSEGLPMRPVRWTRGRTGAEFKLRAARLAARGGRRAS